jgi:hypothetical protein
MSETLANTRRPRLSPKLHPFIAGTVGGACGLLVAFPLDTIRIRMQLSSKTQHISSLETFRSTVRNEGAAALFRGVWSPLTMVAVQKAISFGSYAFFHETFKSYFSSRNYSPSVSQVAAGSAAGVVNALVSVPIDQIKIRLQADQQKSTVRDSLSIRGTFSKVRQIYREAGFATLYRGWQLACVKDVMGYALYFFLFEQTKELLIRKVSRPNHLPDAVSVWFAGGLTGMVGWAVVYPLDVIKSHIQNDRYGRNEPRQFATAAECVQNLIRSGGLTNLYRGMVPTLMRAFLGHSVLFLAFDATMKALR